ncbi:hypothetical protein H6F78_15320 [Coleofasciculus sp. FACHB-64]|uniref:hypothetical protein n=1 Tax=Cyanophyceae TaxID=3028117 RepID=UPI0016834FEF|nr:MULTISPECIES: hypothetical protein [unclassified Coleofasciculus]MBD1837707.1 hypothetical protein [Coleofasciculus sp. FACHB-501]MBD2046951.1 hypothetical protein [Coleofasciculus sp. FACHB-64]
MSITPSDAIATILLSILPMFPMQDWLDIIHLILIPFFAIAYFHQLLGLLR